MTNPIKVKKMSSKISETNLTKFLKNELYEWLVPQVRKLGFHYCKKEKTLCGIKFDIYSYSKKKGIFAIWELEIKQQRPESNIKKLNKILNFQWKPKVFLFHIFSSFRTESDKWYCFKEDGKLRKKYPRRFKYIPLLMRIPRNKLENIVKSFQKNKYVAKHRYGPKLNKEMRRLGKETIGYLR